MPVVSNEIPFESLSYVKEYSARKYRFNEDYTIDVLYWNGKAKRYDVKGYLCKNEFRMNVLENLELFLHPDFTDDEAVHWDDNADITAEWIYEDGIDIEPF